MSQSYREHQESIQAEQSAMAKEDIKQQMEQQAEFAIDLNNLPKQQHNWVDRGAKLSCEGAGHPHHSHFKFKR